MKQKIITALTKDVGLKILAFIFAFLLWLVVVNIDDPTQTRTFTSVVTVTNGDVLKSAGKLYEINCLAVAEGSSLSSQFLIDYLPVPAQQVLR